MFRGFLVGLGGLEPPTSSLSVKRSNHLSYRPKTASLSLMHPRWVLKPLLGPLPAIPTIQGVD